MFSFLNNIVINNYIIILVEDPKCVEKLKKLGELA